jgi:uncharacterized protein
MLKRTFIHIPGIGAKTEARLWCQGMTSVNQLLEKMIGPMDPDSLSGRQQKTYQIAEDSMRALDEGNWRFFHAHLPANQQWRLLGAGLKTAYLDIETSGLEPITSHITTIAVYDGSSWKTYIHGRDLDAFKTDIAAFELIVTYNGKTFDIPFIQNSLDIRLDIPHVDLRYPLAALGYSGGLKRIEAQLGLGRTGAMGDVDGELAVRLWYEYIARRTPQALESLLAYNLEDVFNLAPLATRVFNRSLPECFRHLQLPDPPPRPRIPYTINDSLIRRLTRSSY